MSLEGDLITQVQADLKYFNPNRPDTYFDPVVKKDRKYRKDRK